MSNLNLAQVENFLNNDHRKRYCDLVSCRLENIFMVTGKATFLWSRGLNVDKLDLIWWTKLSYKKEKAKFCDSVDGVKTYLI